MLINVNEYSLSLKRLWADVFGDSEEYINLLFDYGYLPAECFAEIEKDEVVSALYLLKCSVNIAGVDYEGRYLYAAATSVSHRGKGLMAKLILEAQKYIRDEGISFIALVPANEGLYGYYGKFGFETLMSNFSAVTENSGNLACDEEITEIDEFISMRKICAPAFLDYAGDTYKYALSCLKFAGYKIFRNSTDSYFIINKDRTEILEYVSSEENFIENTNKLMSVLKEGTKIISPYDLSDFCKCEKNKFGMIYSADKDFNQKITGDIYMNIALD